MDEKTIARFWSKVDKNGPVPPHCPDLGKCWIWKASRDRLGYGRFGLRTKVIRLAHRISREISDGPPPPGLGVLHRCDTPSCVNPQHLFLGTKQDNSSDMVAKGRQAAGARSGPRRHPGRLPRGERHGMAKISDMQAAEILELYKGRGRGPTLEELATRFGVSRACIGAIVKGASFQAAHDGRAVRDERFKLSDEDVRKILEMYRGPRNGPTLAEVGKCFGVSGTMVRLIVLGKTRKRLLDEPLRTDDKGSRR